MKKGGLPGCPPPLLACSQAPRRAVPRPALQQPGKTEGRWIMLRASGPRQAGTARASAPGAPWGSSQQHRTARGAPSAQRPSPQSGPGAKGSPQGAGNSGTAVEWAFPSWCKVRRCPGYFPTSLDGSRGCLILPSATTGL